MKNIGRIVLPIIILLLTVRINAVPVKAFDMIVRNLPNSEQLPTKELLCIFQDSEGYMWYGTEGGGLCRDDGYMVKVFRSDFKNPGVLENNSVTCITEDGEGKIWFGTKRGVYILSKTDYEIRALADENEAVPESGGDDGAVAALRILAVRRRRQRLHEPERVAVRRVGRRRTAGILGRCRRGGDR